jgi:prepilin-type N-terminal cleavage/methylation domain-containing protein
MTHLIKRKTRSKLAVKPVFAVSYSATAEYTQSKEAGFSLIEVVIAMVIILVALLGVFVTFTYAISYNAGNNSRAQAVAILQREVELLRSAKFTPSVRDSVTSGTPDNGSRDITGGVKTARNTTSADGNRFIVETKIDNDPSTEAIDSGNEDTTTIKQITVSVKLANPTPGWQTSVPITVVLRRVRSN